LAEQHAQQHLTITVRSPNQAKSSSQQLMLTALNSIVGFGPQELAVVAGGWAQSWLKVNTQDSTAEHLALLGIDGRCVCFWKLH